MHRQICSTKFQPAGLIVCGWCPVKHAGALHYWHSDGLCLQERHCFGAHPSVKVGISCCSLCIALAMKAFVLVILECKVLRRLSASRTEDFLPCNNIRLVAHCTHIIFHACPCRSKSQLRFVYKRIKSHIWASVTFVSSLSCWHHKQMCCTDSRCPFQHQQHSLDVHKDPVRCR